VVDAGRPAPPACLSAFFRLARFDDRVTRRPRIRRGAAVAAAAAALVVVGPAVTSGAATTPAAMTRVATGHSETVNAASVLRPHRLLAIAAPAGKRVAGLPSTAGITLVALATVLALAAMRRRRESVAPVHAVARPVNVRGPPGAG
jgi:hypothetical protein